MNLGLRIQIVYLTLFLGAVASANHLIGPVWLDYTLHLEGKVRSRYDGLSIFNASVKSYYDEDRTNGRGEYELFIRGSDFVSGSFCGSTSYYEICARHEGYYGQCSYTQTYSVCYDGVHLHANLNFSLEPIIVEGLPLGACKRNDSEYISTDGGCKNLRTGNIVSTMSTDTMDLETAKLYCENLEDKGFTDWILPSRAQVTTLRSHASYHLNFDIRNLVWTSDAIVRGKGVVARISTRRAARKIVSFLSHVICVRR